MSVIRTRKNKENPHYGFLISWDPNQEKKGRVKGETEIAQKSISASYRHKKNAESLAQDEVGALAKKGIVRSLILISLILILELVVYLAWIKFGGL
jgi:hypothetical protein